MPSLKELRERQFLTQGKLAQKAGLGRDTVNQIEGGKQKPYLRTIRKLAKALRVQPGDIDFSK